eukprot:2567306-Amphidinium_carterae.1
MVAENCFGGQAYFPLVDSLSQLLVLNDTVHALAATQCNGESPARTLLKFVGRRVHDYMQLMIYKNHIASDI